MAVAQLSDDVIVEIFLRLPAKCLLRFKCLSKSFRAIIHSLHFINTLLTSRSSFPELKMQFPLCDANFDLKQEILPLGSTLDQVYGYCNGLILLNRNPPTLACRFALWNPSTRRYKDFPELPSFPPSKIDFRRIVGSGLGYVESRDEYMTFCMVHAHQDGQVRLLGLVSVLESPCWRRTHENFPRPSGSKDSIGFSPGIGRYDNGYVFWLLENSGGHFPLEVVALDLKEETFSSVPLPASPADPMGLQQWDCSDMLC